MAVVSVPIYLIYAAYAAAAVSAVATVSAQKKGAKFTEQSLKKQAKDEEIQARERELERKKKINKVLAAQITGLGASGISAEGTPQLIAQESIRQESLSGLTDEATRSGRSATLTAKANAARQLGNIQSATTILSSTANIGIGLSQL